MAKVARLDRRLPERQYVCVQQSKVWQKKLNYMFMSMLILSLILLVPPFLSRFLAQKTTVMECFQWTQVMKSNAKNGQLQHK